MRDYTILQVHSVCVWRFVHRTPHYKTPHFPKHYKLFHSETQGFWSIFQSINFTQTHMIKLYSMISLSYDSISILCEDDCGLGKGPEPGVDNYKRKLIHFPFFYMPIVLKVWTMTLLWKENLVMHKLKHVLYPQISYFDSIACRSHCETGQSHCDNGLLSL